MWDLLTRLFENKAELPAHVEGRVDEMVELPIINNIDGLISCLDSIDTLENKINTYKKWEVTVEREKLEHQRLSSEYQRKLREREEALKNIERSTQPIHTESEIPPIPKQPANLWLPSEPYCPTQSDFRNYQRTVAQLEDVVQRAPLKLHIFVVYQTLMNEETIDFKGYELRFSSAEKPQREECDGYCGGGMCFGLGAENYKYEKYFSLLMLKSDEFQRLVCERKLSEHIEKAHYSYLPLIPREIDTFSTEEEMQAYLQTIQKRLQEIGFSNYKIFMCQPEEHVHWYPEAPLTE